MGLHVRLLGEAPMPPSDADLAFKIDFRKGQGDPRRVFDAASELIEAFELFDEALIDSLGGGIKPVLVLEDVEAGSIKVWLRNIIKRVDDQALKDFDWRKQVGKYVVRAKYLALEYLDDESSSGSVRSLQDGIRKLAEETDVRHLPDYPPVNEARLITALDRMQQAKSELANGDALIIETEDRTYTVDLTKTWRPSESIVPAQTTETISEGEVILTIRKPDFIKDTMWQFSLGKNNISAPIQDEAWLIAFHDRKIPLLPGDALRCAVKTIYVYDEKGVMIEQRMEILKVLAVLKASGTQTSFLDGR